MGRRKLNFHLCYQIIFVSRAGGSEFEMYRRVFRMSGRGRRPRQLRSSGSLRRVAARIPGVYFLQNSWQIRKRLRLCDRAYFHLKSSLEARSMGNSRAIVKSLLSEQTDLIKDVCSFRSGDRRSRGGILACCYSWKKEGSVRERQLSIRLLRRVSCVMTCFSSLNR